MRPNGSSQDNVGLPVPQNQARLVFERMGRSAGRLTKDLSPANVHQFRTNSRRVEALIGELTPESRNKRKLLKLLSRLRKKAGKLRDVDVQIVFLGNQKVSDRQNHRSQMLEVLSEERLRRARKLAKAANPEAVAELRKRLRREQGDINFSKIDPLRLALASLPRPGEVPITEKTLHAFRIAAKRSRYLAELGGNSPEAKFFVQELKATQDAIGEWHDILKLKQKAEKRFGNASDSALVSVLQNVSRARFRSASATLTSMLDNLSKTFQPARPPKPAVTAALSAASASGAVA